jgi:hypothetical protein
MVCSVLVLGFAADQEFKPTLGISGAATAKLGYNLDTGVFSLKNSFDSDITFTFLGENSAEKTAEGTYGYIKLKDFKFTFDSDDFDKTAVDKGGFTINEGKIIAKIVSGPMFLTIMDESNATKTVKAGDFGLPNLSDGKFLNADFNDNVKVESLGGSYLYAGYDSEMIDFTLKVVNSNDYCVDPEVDANATTAGIQNANQDATEEDFDEDADLLWFLAPSVAVTVSDITLKAGAVFGTQADGATGIGASAEYSLALNETIKIVPSVGFDMKLAAESENLDSNPMAVGAGVFAKWGGKDKYKPYVTSKTSASVLADCITGFKMDGDDVEFQGGAGVAVQYATTGVADADAEINVLAQVIEQRGDDGLVPGLGVAVALEIANVTGANDADPVTKLGAYANYKMGDITPYVRAIYTGATTAAGVDVDAKASFGFGIEVANVIPNTKVTADYSSLNVLADEDNLGVFVAGVKISF